MDRIAYRYPVPYAAVAAALVLLGAAMAVVGVASLYDAPEPSQCSVVRAYDAGGTEVPILGHWCTPK